MEIPRCNNAGIEWNGKMPAGPPLEGPKGESCLSHLREKMPLWKHLIPGKIISLHIEVGKNVCWNKSNALLVSQTQYLAGQPGKKRRHYDLDYTDKSYQCCYPNARQLPYQISGRPSYASSWQQPEAPARQYEPCTQNLTRVH